MNFFIKLLFLNRKHESLFFFLVLLSITLVEMKFNRFSLFNKNKTYLVINVINSNTFSLFGYSTDCYEIGHKSCQRYRKEAKEKN